MKRSRTVSLVVMGLTPLVITACDNGQKSQQTFTSLSSCTAAGVPEASCEAAYVEAVADATDEGPRYATREQCAQDYSLDTCRESAAALGTAWAPVMSGFLIGRIIRSSQTTYYPAGPVFRKRDNTDYSPHYGHIYSGGGSGGGYTGSAGGWRSTPSSEAVGEGDTTGRGGFGGEGGEGGHGS
ncbi:DUF1190 domain-containing protein [Dyella nitratireducens]|uniref:DUF1190 domain-containing protein n=1 Tax=Dyella nitratireducens TaxID=1849580 RepID=A0ABQ1GJ53_9GAMM|nr:DUF1190 domain-containing protein [Dyella nitratireducens]GGA44838.1 hypothetical protein GCM10010981_37370 [Dyella nitratireducens]GLQ41239.1 hypothetical protein GCM10007902_10890 [Dyella nitratireducens]